MDDVEEHFWTGSKVVLGYIMNDVKKFHVYISNRVQQIRDHSTMNSWHHIPWEDNPADHASRGLRLSRLKDSNWFNGPEFLYATHDYQQKRDSRAWLHQKGSQEGILPHDPNHGHSNELSDPLLYTPECQECLCNDALLHSEEEKDWNKMECTKGQSGDSVTQIVSGATLCHWVTWTNTT